MIFEGKKGVVLVVVLIISTLYPDEIGEFIGEYIGKALTGQEEPTAHVSHQSKKIEPTKVSAPIAKVEPKTPHVEQAPIKKKHNLLPTKEVDNCINLTERFEQLKSQHDVIVSNAKFEQEEYKVYKDDIKELKKELKVIDKEIASYLNTLESYRQPVPQNQVDEYNEFTDQHNKLVMRYIESEEVLNEVINDLNTSSKNFHRLREESENLSKTINQLGDRIQSECKD